MKPKPVVHEEGEPFIPYVERANFHPTLKERSERYAKRMGFLPNCNKLYAHRPEIAAPLWDLNSAVMRDPSSTLPQGLKRRIAARLAKLNNSTYCVSHHCGMLQRADSGDKLKDEGWELSDADMHAVVTGGGAAARNDFEAACFDFAEAMTSDPASVPEALYAKVKKLLTPPQIVELACVVGFWKFYNTVHSGLKVPLEQHLVEFSGWVTAE